MVSGTGKTDSLLVRSKRLSEPCHHPAIMAFARWIAPRYLRRPLNIVQVNVAQEDAARLTALRGQRVVLTPNHPAFDPVVIFQLSTKLGMSFCYLTARELFDNPLQAFVISRVGAYAVRRGVRDDDALHTSRQLIRDGKHWLVLFPEGEAHYLHDIVLPFLPGAASLGLGALSDLAGPSGTLPPVYLVPVALRYYYLADMRRAMRTSLARLERELGLTAPSADHGWHWRLGRVADHVLDCNELAFGITPPDEHDLQARLDRLRELVLTRAAGALGIEVPLPDQPLRNRLRKIIVAARRIGHTQPVLGGAYARRLYRQRQSHTALLQRELRRVVDFVALTGTYSYDVPTVENFMDVLGRLELEVLGKPHFWGPRAVTVSVGEPLDLRTYYELYTTNPEQASAKAIAQLERMIQALLLQSAHLMTPLPM
jgi:1-acyl-sn-glycerol-3-phosphate acyltransferase